MTEVVHFPNSSLPGGISDGCPAGGPVVFVRDGRVFTDQASEALFGLFAQSLCNAIELAQMGHNDMAWKAADELYRQVRDAGLAEKRHYILHAAAIREIMAECSWRSAELTGAHPAFVRQLPTLLPGANLGTKEDFVPKGKADFLVWVDGRLRPVEIKRGAFRSNNITQLRRYMDVYGADVGYACALSLECNLPIGMVFLPLARWY